MVDKFIHIMQENNIRVDDIEKVKAIAVEMCTTRDAESMTTEEDFSWNSPYLFGCAAYGINRARWHEADVLQDPRIREFMKKVEYEVTEEGKGASAVGKDLLLFTITGTEIVTREGKIYREIGNCKNGACEIKRMTDEEIIEKFINNVGRVLQPDKANEAVETMLDLEKLEDITELIKLVTL